MVSGLVLGSVAQLTRTMSGIAPLLPELLRCLVAAGLVGLAGCESGYDLEASEEVTRMRVDRHYARIPYDDRFSPEELSRIRLGRIPRDHDDKWSITYRASVLTISRSGEEQAFFRVHLDEGTGEARVVLAEVAIERMADARQGEIWSQVLPWLIRGYLLGQPYPTPEL